MIQADSRAEANKLLHISIRPEFQPLAQEARNSTNRAFHCHGRKYRDAKPGLGQEFLAEGFAHNPRDIFLFRRKYPVQHAGAFVYAFCRMQLHDQLAPGGHGQVCKWWQNISIKLSRPPSKDVVGFRNETQVRPVSVAVPSSRPVPVRGQRWSSDLDSFLWHATPAHKIILLHLSLHPDGIAVRAFEDVTSIQRAMMACDVHQTALPRQQQWNPGIGVAIIGTKHSL